MKQMENFITDLLEMRACREALVWIRDGLKKDPTLSLMNLWKSCSEPEWLMWLLMKKGSDSSWPNCFTVFDLMCDIVEKYTIQPLEADICSKENYEILRAALGICRCYKLSYTLHHEMVWQQTMETLQVMASTAVEDTIDAESYEIVYLSDRNSRMIASSAFAIHYTLLTARNVIPSSAVCVSNVISHAVLVSTYSHVTVDSVNSFTYDALIPLSHKVRSDIANYIRANITPPFERDF